MRFPLGSWTGVPYNLVAAVDGSRRMEALHRRTGRRRHRRRERDRARAGPGVRGRGRSRRCSPMSNPLRSTPPCRRCPRHAGRAAPTCRTSRRSRRCATRCSNGTDASTCVCNNAGVSTFNLLADQTLDDWRWVLGVNLWGVDPRGARPSCPCMRAQGTPAHIVNTASVAGILSGVAVHRLPTR